MKLKIGFPAALFLLFLALKLTGHIGWSWWWVTAPLWLPVGCVVAFFLLLTVFGLLVALVK